MRKSKSRVHRKAGRAANRFHIDVRSRMFTVGDIEWAQILCMVNLVLHRWPHVEAVLEEVPGVKETPCTH